MPQIKLPSHAVLDAATPEEALKMINTATSQIQKRLDEFVALRVSGIDRESVIKGEKACKTLLQHYISMKKRHEARCSVGAENQEVAQLGAGIPKVGDSNAGDSEAEDGKTEDSKLRDNGSEDDEVENDKANSTRDDNVDAPVTDSNIPADNGVDVADHGEVFTDVDLDDDDYDEDDFADDDFEIITDADVNGSEENGISRRGWFGVFGR
ncbi:hypothetical protein P154DRAFT_570272 [Amniculicola lignicola CBS 123094]|uniref:Uncharacterized protein n=1 Tax=Amniculicola lignicola CBS 123094 TaxID=1392246 RepID=A0A6A5WYX4_9PLEO|nr:hypothetical protein P154DRAFT_570272 [Amniculicola lignicola CBS 123094]